MNPTAFPVRTSLPAAEHRDRPTQEGPHEWQHPGMSLRDYFACAAMQALVCVPLPEWPITLRDATNSVSEAAYTMADAMLAARAKGGAA